MQILDGKAVAQARRAKIAQAVNDLKVSSRTTPGLAVVLVGEDPASQVYVQNKIKACHEVGFQSFEHRVPATTSAAHLKALIQKLNDDPQIHGILVQLPLPAPLNSEEVLSWIAPRKDADCLTTENLGRLWTSRPLTVPCTPAGVMAILEHYQIDVRGMEAVVIGRSHIVGKPMAHLLTEANATVTVCHSKTQDVKRHTTQADLVVVAAGKPEFLGAGDFKKDAIVIDVGIHRKPSASGGKPTLCGDVRLKELEGIVKAATPVPGGVGPMTITMLLENTLTLARNSLKI